MSLSLDSDLEKIFLKILKLRSKTIVFQTDVLNTSIFYKTDPKKLLRKSSFLLKKYLKIKRFYFQHFLTTLFTKKNSILQNQVLILD